MLHALLLSSLTLAQTDAKLDWRELTQKPLAKLSLPEQGLEPLLAGAEGKKITTKEEWRPRRLALEDDWKARLGKAPEKAKDLDVRIEETVEEEDHVRQLVTFQATKDNRIRAYLLIPKHLVPKPGGRASKAPAVVVFHQTTKDTLKEPAGLGKNPTLAIGLHLVKRGYVVLCPECFILQDGWAKEQAAVIAKLWPGWTGMGKMTFDASRCIDFLESLGFVDASRIGCIGHSLGAKETLYALAFDGRYKAGVFSEGGIGLRMSNWADAWYLTERMTKFIPKMEHHQLLALVAPRPILIVGGDSADGDLSWAFIQAALPVYELLGAGERIGLVNHHAKHTFPRAARALAYRWLDRWLDFTPTSNEVGPEK
jgi:dienelactone hydrolase